IAAGLAGDGGLAKTGGGTLIYTGDGSRMAGVTQVAAGTLAVHGQLGGRLEVLQGATLAGTGRIGRLDLHGQLDLGGPGGHMDVQDDAVFHAGSIWNLHADAAGQAGRLAVAGRASIDPESTLAVPADR